MTLREILVERRAALCERWLEAILGEYGSETAARWRRERDPFANPIGHVLGTSLPTLLEAVAGDGQPAAGALGALEDVVRIRCVQELAPSRAVGFVYLLRDVIRGELASELAGGGHGADLAAVDRRIERLTLLAFDAYVHCREQIFRLRQEELKRSVGSILRHWHANAGPDPGELVPLSPPPGRNATR
jgi:hypothetical protein